jgi:hypothetical protein
VSQEHVLTSGVCSGRHGVCRGIVCEEVVDETGIGLFLAEGGEWLEIPQHIIDEKF